MLRDGKDCKGTDHGGGERINFGGKSKKDKHRLRLSTTPLKEFVGGGEKSCRTAEKCSDKIGNMRVAQEKKNGQIVVKRTKLNRGDRESHP